MLIIIENEREQKNHVALHNEETQCRYYKTCHAGSKTV